MRHKIVFLIMIISSSSPILAASFDCAKAITEVEKNICSDQDLSFSDTQMGLLYQEGLRKTEDRGALIEDQKEWLKYRNRCTDISCLKSWYRIRIDELRSWYHPSPISTRRTEEPPFEKTPIVPLDVDTEVKYYLDGHWGTMGSPGGWEIMSS